MLFRRSWCWSKQGRCTEPNRRAIGQITLAVEQSTPTVDQSTLTVKTSKLTVKTSTLTVKTSEPTVKTSTLIVKISKLIVKTSEPTVKTSKHTNQIGTRASYPSRRCWVSHLNPTIGQDARLKSSRSSFVRLPKLLTVCYLAERLAFLFAFSVSFC